MKINFGLLGLAAAQSGDDRWEDNSYDYDVDTERWGNENQFSLDQVNAGITFGVQARVTKQQDARHFQKALKLSCWNSNMIRDMNNDNKFSVYFNDQVEYKRFHPGIPTGTNGGTVDTLPGRDDLSWLYAVGDLRTGNNHQYGFEHTESDPYYKVNTDTDTNRQGGASATNGEGRNNNRLRQLDEREWTHGYTDSVTDSTITTVANASNKTKVMFNKGIHAGDEYHSVRPDTEWSHRKWGYQSDNVERAESGGYAEDTVVYHFGHHDNTDNTANRPNFRYAASSDTIDETLNSTTAERNASNMHGHEFDFYGFKDDWRYSLRMGGCLYEAARWVYDESSFHRTSRLTYTDDTLFMNDPFDPLDGSDIFGAHFQAAHTTLSQDTTSNPTLSYYNTEYVNAQTNSAALYAVYQASTCASTPHGGDAPGNAANGCDSLVVTMGSTYATLSRCFEITANATNCTLAPGADPAACYGTGAGCEADYNAFIAARDAVFKNADNTGCLADNGALSAHCGTELADTAAVNASAQTVTLTNVPGELLNFMVAKEAEGAALAARENAAPSSTYGDQFLSAYHEGTTFSATDPATVWENAGSTAAAAGDYVHGNCNGTTSCESHNVATPSSGGVFADVHWVHVFNAHIFPLQDVGYYQYDQTLGLGNITAENDSITSRDGYGYNIYTGSGDGKAHVLRDVWGAEASTSYWDSANNAPLTQQVTAALQTGLVTANKAYLVAWNTFDGTTCSNNPGGDNTAATGGVNLVASYCDGYVSDMANKYEILSYCMAIESHTACQSAGVDTTVNCGNDANGPCYGQYQAFSAARDLVWNEAGDAGCLYDATTSAVKDGCSGSATNHATITDWFLTSQTSVNTLLTAAKAAGDARAALANKIEADQFHSQYGTLNIGNIDGHGTSADPTNTGYTAAATGSGAFADDFYPILTKTRRKIEDFNIVMANPTYEGHGFLNFVATYHDHTENFNDSANVWIRQVGKRFLSTIGGLTTASNEQRNVCRAVKDGIDSYRMNGFIPAFAGGTNVATGGHTFQGTGYGHDDPFLSPMGPGPAGNYGNGQRCGAAMYENFGDWFLRPAQTYSAYNKFSQTLIGGGGVDGADGWGTAACADAASAGCMGGLESYNYWAFILSEDYNPITGEADHATNYYYQSQHELWRNGSKHYDFPGDRSVTDFIPSKRKRRQVTGPALSNIGIPRSSGRGFAISSFPHNELGKDFRFNIRTLHNMGNGVAKQYYQIQALASDAGNETGTTGSTQMATFLTSNLRTSETVWSYYFYAVDTIKIAFPEFVARVNHCDKHNQRNHSHCTVENTLPTGNGNPDATNQANLPTAYPGYTTGFPHYRLGFQDIIIDGVTMKKTDNHYDSRNSERTGTDWNEQYHFARGLRGDDHTRATLHYTDKEFANEDASLNDWNANLTANQMCGADMTTFNMGKSIFFYGGNGSKSPDLAGQPGHFQGYTDSYQPLKPCASWCALDEFATNVLSGQGIDHSLQSQDGANLTGYSSIVPSTTSFSEYGGICGRVLRIDGLLQTYDELHNRQYGVLQEIWVQLQYAYQESLDNSIRTKFQETCNDKDLTGTNCNDRIRKVQSPFPNVFFSAPEVVDIRGFCPSSNMKCRGYMTDQHQPYGGARDHASRVHWNESTTRATNSAYGFGANQIPTAGIQSGNDWAKDRDFHADSKWPWNYHSYTADQTDLTTGTGIAYGGTAAGTKYTGIDYNHTPYSATGGTRKK